MDRSDWADNFAGSGDPPIHDTIVAETAGIKVLAVSVNCFDATLERDPDFARRMLALETLQLQRVSRNLPATPLGGSSRRPEADATRAPFQRGLVVTGLIHTNFSM